MALDSKGRWVPEPNQSTTPGAYQASVPSTSGSSSSFSYSVGGSSPANVAVANPNFLGSNQNGRPTNMLQEQPGTNPPFYAPPTFMYNPPTAPDLSGLQQLKQQTRAQNNKQIKAAMNEYDAMTAATQSMGFQSAQNAGNVYAGRLQQQGINPLASGVVAAQSRLPVWDQLNKIGAEKARVRIDSSQKADALAAQIASTIANLNSTYTAQLADYNKATAGYQLDLNKFNAAQALRASDSNRDYDLKVRAQQMAEAESAARISALSNSTTKGHTSGASYTPTWAERASMMQAANMGTGGSPGAVNYWNQIFQKASQQNILDRPSFDLIAY